MRSEREKARSRSPPCAPQHGLSDAVMEKTLGMMGYKSAEDFFREWEDVHGRTIAEPGGSMKDPSLQCAVGRWQHPGIGSKWWKIKEPAVEKFKLPGQISIAASEAEFREQATAAFNDWHHAFKRRLQEKDPDAPSQSRPCCDLRHTFNQADISFEFESKCLTVPLQPTPAWENKYLDGTTVRDERSEKSLYHGTRDGLVPMVCQNGHWGMVVHG